MKKGVPLLTVVGLLTFGHVARADTVISTPALVQDDLDTLICSLLSTKSKPVDGVKIELVREDGTVIAGLGPFTLQPFNDRTIIWISGEDPAYCRATGKLSKRKTSLSLCGALSPYNRCVRGVTAP